jgi:hypothetical protein
LASSLGSPSEVTESRKPDHPHPHPHACNAPVVGADRNGTLAEEERISSPCRGVQLIRCGKAIGAVAVSNSAADQPTIEQPTARATPFRRATSSLTGTGQPAGGGRASASGSRQWRNSGRTGATARPPRPPRGQGPDRDKPPLDSDRLKKKLSMMRRKQRTHKNSVVCACGVW